MSVNHWISVWSELLGDELKRAPELLIFDVAWIVSRVLLGVEIVGAVLDREHCSSPSSSWLRPRGLSAGSRISMAGRPRSYQYPVIFSRRWRASDICSTLSALALCF